MQLLDNEFARRDGLRLQVRDEPLRVRWTVDDLTASDGHRIRCAFGCSVRAVPDPTEQKMLAEVLLQHRPAAFERDVADHFLPTLRDALARMAAQKTGTELVSDEGRAALADVLKTAAKPVAFACGVEVLPPFEVQVESPSIQEQRLRSMQRALAEEHAAGQLQHVQRAGELLKQFQAIRQATPDLSAGHVLQQVSPADRGALLQTLLLASAKGVKQTLWAVAGPNLIRLIDPVKPELFPLPATLGPLRSVQPADVDGRRVLLIGARAGFYVVDPENLTATAEAYADPEVTSQLGFSRVVYIAAEDAFAACHSEAGVVFWMRGESDKPSRAVRIGELPVSFPTPPATGSKASHVPGPRNLQANADGSVVYSVGNKTVNTGLDGKSRVPVPGSSSDVVGIIAGEGPLVVVHEDGTVCAINCRTTEAISAERRAGRLRAAAPLPWIGGCRLLLASEEGPIYCVGLEDDLVTQYVSPLRDLRMVTGSAERVVAVSSDRQRLIVWNAWDGRKPVAEIYLAGIARHRVADVDFG